MSMTATFVQVDAAELAHIQANPSLAEALFQQGPLIPPQFGALTNLLEQRMRAAGPQMMARALGQLDPRVRQRLEERLGRSADSFSTGAGAEDLLKQMRERFARASAADAPKARHTSISLDKEWHGVHYLLCGKTEPDDSLVSQAVLGGAILGEDDEGFSGYGPARAFTPEQVAALSQALSASDLEAQAAARFDAGKTTSLEIYPGWRASDAEEVMNAFRRLREFYADAAGKGRAIVTCLV